MSVPMSNCAEKISLYHKSSEIDSFIKELNVGDLIELTSEFQLFNHWAVVVEIEPNVTIVHKVMIKVKRQLDNDEWIDSHIIESDFKQFLLKSKRFRWKFRKNNTYDEHSQPLPVDMIIQEAKRLLLRDGQYNIITSNCEMFAKLCRYGQKSNTFDSTCFKRFFLMPLALAKQCRK
ncbi:hypothetical protein CHUAL_012488 [Chamberlinius hualienensis]